MFSRQSTAISFPSKSIDLEVEFFGAFIALVRGVTATSALITFTACNMRPFDPVDNIIKVSVGLDFLAT